MNLRNQQIKSLYEQGVAVEDIQSAFPELSIDAIKICLMGCSGKYRKEVKDSKEVFGDDTDKFAQVIEELAFDPDCPANVRFKAATFGINEVKGRNDPRKMATKVTNNLNVNILNAHLKAVDAAYQRAKEQKVIELPKESRELLEKAS